MTEQFIGVLRDAVRWGWHDAGSLGADGLLQDARDIWQMLRPGHPDQRVWTCNAHHSGCDV